MESPASGSDPCPGPAASPAAAGQAWWKDNQDDTRGCRPQVERPRRGLWRGRSQQGAPHDHPRQLRGLRPGPRRGGWVLRVTAPRRAGVPGQDPLWPGAQPPALIGVSCSWDQSSARRGHQGRRTGHSLSGPTGSPEPDDLGVRQCQRGAVPSAPSSHPGCCPGRGSRGQQVSTQPHPCPPFPTGMPPRSTGSRGADAALPGPPVGPPASPAGWASAPHWPLRAGPGGRTGAPQGLEAHVSGALPSWTLGSSSGDTAPCAGPGSFPPAGWPSIHALPG